MLLFAHLKIVLDGHASCATWHHSNLAIGSIHLFDSIRTRRGRICGRRRLLLCGCGGKRRGLAIVFHLHRLGRSRRRRRLECGGRCSGRSSHCLWRLPSSGAIILGTSSQALLQLLKQRSKVVATIGVGATETADQTQHGSVGIAVVVVRRRRRLAVCVGSLRGGKSSGTAIRSLRICVYWTIES